MRHLATLALLVGLLSCGDDTAPATAPVCVAGQQVACACPGNGLGAQACRSDGSGYEECVCLSGTGGSSGAAGAGGAGGTGGMAGSGGSGGVAGTGGTAGSGGSGGTMAADPLPAGVYQLSCLWRPLGLAVGYPQRARADVTGAEAKKIALTWFNSDATAIPVAAPQVTSTSLTISTQGEMQVTLPDFILMPGDSVDQNDYLLSGVTILGHVTSNLGCLELAGSAQVVPDQGENPLPVDLDPSGDVCLLVPAPTDGSASVPTVDAYSCAQ